MRILLTNDDGIHAEGLAALERIARTISDDVWVVAPETRPVRLRAFAVAVASRCGCARSARSTLPCAARRPTASSWACAGCCRSRRISSCPASIPAPTSPTTSPIPARSPAPWKARCSASARSRSARPISSRTSSASFPTRPARRWRRRCSKSCSASTCRPASSSTSISRTARPTRSSGTRVTSQGKLAYNLGVEERADGRGLPYYWLRFGRDTTELREGTDLHAVKSNFVSVTPLKLDLTAHELRDQLTKALA